MFVKQMIQRKNLKSLSTTHSDFILIEQAGFPWDSLEPCSQHIWLPPPTLCSLNPTLVICSYLELVWCHMSKAGGTD